MELDDIFEQENAKRKLKLLLENKKINNAYIFEGIEGIGKKFSAMCFASQLVGVSAVNSPDFTLIEPKKGESTIKIDSIRNLNKTIISKPYSSWKIYLIDGAEKMTIQAQNALLKTLEEPPSYGIIILVTKNKEALLSTIKSRCMEIKFSPLSLKTIERELIKKEISKEKASLAAFFSRGSLEKAIDISKDTTLINMREDIETLIKHIVVDKNFIAAIKADEIAGKYKNKKFYFLELIQNYFRDVYVYKSGCEKKLLINMDKVDLIEEISRYISFFQISEIMDILEQTEKKLKSNCNFNISMETMAINIYKILNID